MSGTIPEGVTGEDKRGRCPQGDDKGVQVSLKAKETEIKRIKAAKTVITQ